MRHSASGAIRALAADVLACLRFYSALRVPVWAFEADPYAMLDFSRAIRMLPVAGALIGATGAAVLVLADASGMPSLVSAALAIATLVRVTGCFHEDGLADVADGFGGGGSRERKLEIMKDSRIGAFGAVALALSLIIRSALIAALLGGFGALPAAAALIAAASVSRVAGLLPLALLSAARTDGAAHAAHRPSLAVVGLAGAVALVGALIVLGPCGIGTGRIVLGCLAAVAAALYMAGVSRRAIAGQTGDVGGAAQQLAEMGFLATLLAAPHFG